MQFGLYTPGQVTTVGSPEIARQIQDALSPLSFGQKDSQFGICEQIVMEADAVGFEIALFAERHLGSDLSAWVMAGAVGARMKNIRALVAVHPGLWNPAMIAKIAASVDRICDRRMAINIVNGWYEDEFNMFGGVVIQGDERYRRSSEFIEVLRRLWTEDRVSYDGEFYKLDNAHLPLRPASPQPPDVFSVSSTAPGREFIANNCDWWFISAPKSPETTHDDLMRSIESSINSMDLRARELGRKVRFAFNPFVSIADDADKAFNYATEKIFAYDQDPANRSSDRTRQIERRMLPATKAGCMGRAEDICKQVKRFEDLGIELLLIKFIPTVENVRQIGEEIIARVGSR